MRVLASTIEELLARFPRPDDLKAIDELVRACGTWPLPTLTTSDAALSR